MNLASPTPYNRVLQCNQRKLNVKNIIKKMTTAWLAQALRHHDPVPNGHEHIASSRCSHSYSYARFFASGASHRSFQRHRIDSGFVRRSTTPIAVLLSSIVCSALVASLAHALNSAVGNRVDFLSTRIILVLWPFISQTCKLVSSFGALTRLLASVEYMRSSRVERICKGFSVQCAAKEQTSKPASTWCAISFPLLLLLP